MNVLLHCGLRCMAIAALTVPLLQGPVCAADANLSATQLVQRLRAAPGMRGIEIIPADRPDVRPYVDLDIQFDVGSARIAATSEQALAELAKALTAPDLKTASFRIAGHTDARGNPELNRQLSLRRAISVKAALVRSGVEAYRLSAEGFGSSRPAFANDPMSERNRRVEIRRLGETATAPVPGTAAAGTSSNHALLITVENYPEQPLPGTRIDQKTARKMAIAMGVPEANITLVSDSKATEAGMLDALRALNDRVMPGDRVMVYYSGHGARIPAENGCAESLVSVDGNLISSTTVAELLKPIGRKADKLIVFLDSCHSGGVASATRTREIGGAKTTLRAKNYVPRGAAKGEECERIANVRAILRSGVEADTTNNNIIVIAAARSDEVALDDEVRGGLATSNFFECMGGLAKDTDHSGAISMAEIASCAQDRVNSFVREKYTQVLPPNFTLRGNSELVPSFAASTVPVSTGATDTLAVMNGIFKQRDDRKAVTVEVPKSTLRIGQDKLDLTIKSATDGFAYVFYAGSSGSSFYLLYPNVIDQDNVVRAGQALRLPRPDWEITVQGPTGKDHLLVLVTDSPRDFTEFQLPSRLVGGAFTTLPNDASTAARLASVAVLSGQLNGTTCAPDSTGKRDQKLAKSCSSAYGAAMVTVEEVQ